MESPNAPPAHDFFTPAWLKLPDPQVSKKSASTVSPSSHSGVETQHKRYSNSYSTHRKELNNSTNSLSNCESRERFHDSSLPSLASQPYLSSRHNSFGSEQQFNKPEAQTIGSNVNGFRAKKYIDSNRIDRSNYRPNYRDKQSTHHSSTGPKTRHDRTDRSDRNDSYKYYKKQFNNKSSDFGLDNEWPEKTGSNEENHNVFNQEFPSLVNDANGGHNRPNDNSSFESAWSNNATKSKVLSTSKKFQLIHSSVANFDNIESVNKSDANSGSNASKAVISSPVYRNISLIGKSKAGIMKENAVYSKIQPMLTKTSPQTTPAMEILVKNPKKRSNKSDFLNSIRNDQNKDKTLDKELEQKLEICGENRNFDSFENLESISGQKNSFENDFKNTQNIQNINNKYIFGETVDDYEDEEDMTALSSSLEAEHRLLMELGWKAEPDDDPSYAPLTEDEVKEFKDLINARNGFKRNTTQTQNTTTLSNQTIHMNSSPKKWATSDDLDEESSSSSDDD